MDGRGHCHLVALTVIREKAERVAEAGTEIAFKGLLDTSIDCGGVGRVVGAARARSPVAKMTEPPDQTTDRDRLTHCPARPRPRPADLPRDFYRPKSGLALPGPARLAIQIYAHLPTRDGPRIFHLNPTFAFRGKQREGAGILASGICQLGKS